MIVPTSPLPRANQPGPIPDIDEDDIHYGREMVDPRAGTLHDPDRLARIDQPLHKMAADESRPARHDCQAIHANHGSFVLPPIES